MSLRRRLQGLAQDRLDRGGWLKMRHAFPDPRLMLRALRTGRVPGSSPSPAGARIVVVGLGIAALTVLRTLRSAGIDDVTVVAKDRHFGGKCVNVGCMPTAYALAHQGSSPSALQEGLETFIADLRAGAEREFEALGYPLIEGELEAIDGKTLQMVGGKQIAFDVAVLGLGSASPAPTTFAQVSAEIVTLEQLWHVPAGRRLTVYAENNVAALGLGAAARALGLEPTVLLSGREPFGALPSYRHYLRTLAADGVTVHRNTRPLGAESGQVRIAVAGQRLTIPHDHLLVASRPVPRSVPLDGRYPSVFDLDVVAGSLPERPDILFVGDGGGYFTATEAEAQARLLAQAIVAGRRADLRPLDRLPLILDAASPLVLLGSPWTYAETHWIEVDFRVLGWSRIEGGGGKLWALVDPGTHRLNALHICHPAAKELAGLAQVLFDVPLTDPRWHLVGAHPSAAEIFKVLAGRVAALINTPVGRKSGAEPSERVSAFHLPDLPDLSPGGPLPDWLSRADAARVLTSDTPRRSLAALFGLAQLGPATGNGRGVSDGDAATVEYDDREALCRVRGDRHTVVVSY